VYACMVNGIIQDGGHARKPSLSFWNSGVP
jgi:hypothetical protein